jgi:hypothetical protein
MALEATLSKTWKRRMLMITAICTGIGLWFYYDGAFGFPKKNEVFTAHQQFVEEGRETEWTGFARSKGWDPKPPERLYERADLIVQYLLGTVSLLGAFTAAAWLSMCWRRRLRSDGEAVFSDAGVRVPLSAMHRIDKRKWDTKGIAVVTYDDHGRDRRLVIDDYKYAGGDRILAQIEEHLGSNG